MLQCRWVFIQYELKNVKEFKLMKKTINGNFLYLFCGLSKRSQSVATQIQQYDSESIEQKGVHKTKNHPRTLTKLGDIPGLKKKTRIMGILQKFIVKIFFIAEIFSAEYDGWVLEFMFNLIFFNSQGFNISTFLQLFIHRNMIQNFQKQNDKKLSVYSPVQQSPIYNYGKCDLDSHNKTTENWGNIFFKDLVVNLGWQPIQPPNFNFFTQNISNQFQQFYKQNFIVQNNLQQRKIQIPLHQENDEWKKLYHSEENFYPQIQDVQNQNFLGISGKISTNLFIVQKKKKHNFIGVNKNKNNWANQQKEIQKFDIVNTGTDISKFLDQQVIYIQPSSQNQQFRNQEKIFEDPEFPHNQRSLTGQLGYIVEWKNIRWRRLSEMVKNPVIFDQHIEPHDIKQGILGDCYFLSALAALAEIQQRIQDFFLETEQNAQKYYKVKILYKGIWKEIKIDDWVPTLNNQLAFSKSIGSNGRQFWVVLLQKAWAKLFGSYKNIEAGYGQQGLHDLTGAHITAIRLKQVNFDKQKNWQYMLQASMYNYSMTGSTLPGSDRNQAVSGIVMGHAYTIRKVVQLDFQGQQIRLVHLRNPWGKTQSKIEWKNNDPRWNQVSPNQKQRIGYVNIENGSFFYPYKNFLQDFISIAVAQINDNNSYIYLTQKSSIRKGNYFKVTIHKQGIYSFQINQTPQRAYPKNIQKEHKYSNITILIGRVNGTEIEYLKGTQSAYRTAFKKHRLIPGEYVIFGKIFFNKYERDFDMTLGVYGDHRCYIDPCPPNMSANFKQKLYLNKALRSEGKQLSNGLFYNQQILKEGYIYIAFWNNSNQVGRFNLNVTKNKNPTVVLKKPYKGLTKISQDVNPGDSRIILARVSDFGYDTGGIGQLQLN